MQKNLLKWMQKRLEKYLALNNLFTQFFCTIIVHFIICWYTGVWTLILWYVCLKVCEFLVYWISEISVKVENFLENKILMIKQKNTANLKAIWSRKIRNFVCWKVLKKGEEGYWFFGLFECNTSAFTFSSLFFFFFNKDLINLKFYDTKKFKVDQKCICKRFPGDGSKYFYLKSGLPLYLLTVRLKVRDSTFFYLPHLS